MANMKEYPKIDELFSANSEKLIPDITANAANHDLESMQQASQLILNC